MKKIDIELNRRWSFSSSHEEILKNQVNGAEMKRANFGNAVAVTMETGSKRETRDMKG